MNQKVNFVFSIIILMTFVSCNRTRLKNALNPEDFSALAAAKSCEVTYNENIAPLIQNSCVGCHSDAGIASFSKLDSYSALVAHREQVLKQVQTKRMPPIGRAKALTAEELILLETWVSNGSPESKDSCQVLASDECKERIPHLTKNTRRLTNFEFTQTIKDVFGNSAYQYAKAQFQRLPTDTNSRKFFDSEVSNYLSQSLLEAYQVIGETVGFYFIQGASQKAELDACLNNSQPDLGSCVTPWVVKLGAKAYRRPLASEELAILTKIYNDNLIYSVEDSIQMVVAGLIQSPYFVHLVENDLAGETPHADVYVLNQYEIASRLSYALWGSIPDDALMDAAKTGQLNSLDQLKTHAKRMSLDPRARVLASHFFKQYFGVNQVSSPAPSFDFLQGLSTAGLSQAAGAEMEAFSLELYDGNKPYRDFFLSRNAYLDPALTGSETLKTIYGVSTTGAVVLPPERAGILSRAGSLFNSGNHSKPILRGVAIRKYILCDEPPPPPPGADSTAPILDPDMNTNDRAHALTSGGNCFFCHARINPPGFLLAAFDPIGRFREVERIFSSTGQFIKNVSLKLNYAPVIESTSETPVESVSGFMQALSESDVPLNCFSQRRFSFFEGRKFEEADKCIAKNIADTFKSGGVQDLIQGIITPEFLLRKVEE